MAFEELSDFELGNHLRSLRAQIDSLEMEFSVAAEAFRRRGGHLALGYVSAVAWLGASCKMSASSAADRLCVGKELDSVPGLSESIERGEIGFQSAAAVCHLIEQVGDKRERLDLPALLEWTGRFAVKEVRNLCRQLRYAVDPEGAERQDEEDFERRWLKISKLADGMHVIDGILDAVGGAAIKTALEALSSPRSEEVGRGRRRHSQRMADALVELAHHALDSGALPARNGAKPHLNVTTTLEALLQGLPGAPEIDGTPVSQKTLERVACDSTVSRVVLADSVVIDVGRATRSVSSATRRALKARDRHCRFPGCDRPVGWTSAHHIEFWSRGGKTSLQNLVSLCHHHHRLVHEGGWQVVKAGRELKFIPPERPSFMPWRARGPGVRWAA